METAIFWDMSVTGIFPRGEVSFQEGEPEKYVYALTFNPFKTPENRRVFFKKIFSNVGFQVLTALVVKSTIFWDTTPYSPFSVNRRFGGTYRLHLQGRRNKFSKRKPASKQAASRFFSMTTRCHISINDTLKKAPCYKH
jgi:hypothetical protein